MYLVVNFSFSDGEVDSVLYRVNNNDKEDVARQAVIKGYHAWTKTEPKPSTDLMTIEDHIDRALLDAGISFERTSDRQKVDTITLRPD